MSGETRQCGWDDDLGCAVIHHDTGSMSARYVIAPRSRDESVFEEAGCGVFVYALDCADEYRVHTDDAWIGEHSHIILLESAQMEDVERGDVVIDKRTAELVPVGEVDESAIATDEFFGMGMDYLSIDHLDVMCERYFVEMPYAADDLFVFVGLGD